MSVYSGFATRQQQNKYNSLLQTLVIALKKRILKFYQGQPCDEPKFKLVVKKIYKKMYLLQKGKFMTPKYTSCFTDLIESMNIEIDWDAISEGSSRISGSFSLNATGNGNAGDEDNGFKSRNILENKKNFLQSRVKQTAPEAAPLRKKLNTLQIQNFEQSPNQLTSSTIPHNRTNLAHPNHHLNHQTIGLRLNNNNSRRTTSLGLQQHPILGSQTSLNPIKGKKHRQLRQLKELRGTMHMPKVQDFLPKRDQLEPAFMSSPHRLNNLLGMHHNSNNMGVGGNTNSPPSKQFKGFRRQKYSYNEVMVQDV